MRLRKALGLLAGLSLLLLVAPPTSPARALAHNPILFVHGWNSNSSTWNTMVARFQADGWTAAELHNWQYNYKQSNATTAAEIQTKINQILADTGATKVDIITHSMGGLSSRYYLKNIDSTKVDDWVGLGNPNHGTDTANFCFDTSCKEMRIGSTFLASLNSGDETPGAVNYREWWSPCDSVINPDSSPPLSGAVNTQTACLSHGDLHEDATVYAQVRDFVA